jgi:hypothetical protein
MVRTGSARERRFPDWVLSLSPVGKRSVTRQRNALHTREVVSNILRDVRGLCLRMFALVGGASLPHPTELK